MLSTLPKKQNLKNKTTSFWRGSTLKRLIWYQKISKELRHDASMYRDLFSHPYLFLSPSRGVQLIGGMTVAQPNEATTRCLIFTHVYNTISNKYVISNKYIYQIYYYYVLYQRSPLYDILKDLKEYKTYRCNQYKIRYYDVYTYIHCTYRLHVFIRFPSRMLWRWGHHIDELRPEVPHQDLRIKCWKWPST